MTKCHRSVLLKVILCAVVFFASLPAYAGIFPIDNNIGTEVNPHPGDSGYVDDADASNTITNNANVYVIGKALYLGAAASGTNEITNNGIVYSSTDFAVQTDIGIDILTNNSSGTIYGSNGIDLGGGDDIFNNSGILIMDLVDGGTGADILNLSGTASRTFNGNFSNFEYLNKNDAGSWTLGGAVTATNTTNVNAGTLLINGTMTSTDVTVDAGAALGVGGTGNINCDTINVNAGTLLVNGTLAALNANVNTGATLGGTGTIACENPTTSNGGIIAPGVSIGTLTINGSFTSDPNTTFNIEMNGSAADLLSVRRTATITGGTVSVTPTGIIRDGDTRDIITISSTTGTLDYTGTISVIDPSRILSFTVNIPPAGDTIQLIASRVAYASVMSSALAPIYSAIDAAIPSATDDLATFITSLDASSDPGPALKELSPETHGNTSNLGRDVLNSYVRTFVNRMQSLRFASSSAAGGNTRVAGNLTGSGPVMANILSSAASSYKDWSTWAEFFGQIGKQRDKGGQLGYSYDAYGPALGMDMRLSDNVIFGLSTGYARTNVDTNGIDSSTDVDAFNLTVYGTYYETKEYYLDAAVTYGWNWYDSNRTVTGLGDLTSTHKGYDFSVYGGAGYYLNDLIGWDWMSIIPIASVQYGHHGEDSFTETVNGAPFMNIDSINSDSLVSRIGLCLEHRFEMNKVDILANVSGEWGHEYLDTQNTVSAQFTQSAAPAFNTDGIESDRDSFLFGLGFIASITENYDLSFDYDLDLRDKFYAHNFTGKVRLKW